MQRSAVGAAGTQEALTARMQTRGRLYDLLGYADYRAFDAGVDAESGASVGYSPDGLVGKDGLIEIGGQAPPFRWGSARAGRQLLPPCR